MPETPRIHVNTTEHAVTADGDTPLLYVLRNPPGAQGGGVVDALLSARKFKVRVASRHGSQNSGRKPAPSGAKAVKPRAGAMKIAKMDERCAADGACSQKRSKQSQAWERRKSRGVPCLPLFNFLEGAQVHPKTDPQP
jgi:hypothetical protein